MTTPNKIRPNNDAFWRLEKRNEGKLAGCYKFISSEIIKLEPSCQGHWKEEELLYQTHPINPNMINLVFGQFFQMGVTFALKKS